MKGMSLLGSPILIVRLILVLVVASSLTLTGVFLPLRALEFGASKSLIALLMTSFSISMLSSPLWGTLSDRLGRAWFIVAGSFLLMSANVGIYLARGMVPLLALRALQGLAMALFTPSMIALMSEGAPSGRRGVHVSAYSALQSAGWALGSIGAGLLASRYGLDASFIAGALIAGLGGILSISAFLDRERRVLLPTPRKGERFLSLYIASFLRDSSILGAYSLLAIYLKELRWDEGLMGVFFSINMITQVPLMFCAGLLTARIGYIPVTMAGMVGSGVVLLGYAAGRGVELLLVQPLMAFSYACFFVGTRGLASEKAGIEVGRTLGVFSLCRNVGGIVGPIIAGILVENLGFRRAFALLSVLPLVASLMVLVGARESSRKDI